MAQRLRYAELAPEGIAALRLVEHYLNSSTALNAVLLEFVRLRTSQINGCDFCVQSHMAELRKHHEPQSRIDAVADWGASDAFTPRERAALAWAESVTNASQTHVPTPDFEAVSKFFTGKTLADLTIAIANMNAWNRLGVAFQAEWKPRAAGAATVERPSLPTGAENCPDETSAMTDDGSKASQD